ncbi:LysR family transcriptional regulator [Sodalis praecaptivus]|uniref:LysR family transcriptional regulator n=1 Tax=Sodalis praecaptivus TaxID=1239307 RepID=W0HT56_9GAMM|nr:LysR family transcriptional regulator [Sodalis praecaptivus]AHF76996.1 LysR family transcriptional regulator [Sodalis praecaptivus]
MSAPSHTELRIFIAVAERRHFREAADFLGMKPSTLSHAIKGLEERLQVRLFHRTTRSVALTEAGQHFYRRLRPLMRELDDTMNSVTALGKRPAGTLRINGSEAAISILLAEVIPRFNQNFPGIELDLVADGTLSDVIQHGFDAGIRLREDIPQDRVAVRISQEVRFLAVASPAYLASHPPVLTPRDLLQQRCIRQRLPSGKRYAWEFMQKGDVFSLDVPGTLTLNSSPLMVEAAINGLGICFVPEYYARPYFASGALVALLTAWSTASPGLFLYFPPSRHLSFPLQAFIDTIKASRSADRR